MLGLFTSIAYTYLLLLSLLNWGELHSVREHHRSAGHRTGEGCSREKGTGHVEVYTTVSSLIYKTKTGDVIKRQLEVNWYGRTPKVGDRVALFDRDPSSCPFPKAVVKADPSDYPDGYLRTNVEFPYVYFNLSTLAKTPCLGHWVGYLVEGNLVSSSCLQMRPFWMQQNREFLESLRLSEIMIPGSHDSGCFCEYNSKNVDTLVRYKYAQEEPIFNQLVYGLRYFDFRVGFYNNTKERFFINHSFFRTAHSVASILSDVRSFLEATQEIVILDFHLFPVGFDKLQVHLDLMKIIHKSLDPYLIPHNPTYLEATMGELWANGKRVLVSYNNVARRHEPYGVIWPGIPRAWGNKQHPEDLKLYFEGVYSKTVPKGLWASMAELTPNTRFIVRHPFRSLRGLADQINRNVTHWFRDRFWQKANIVATDYFLGNNIIDVAIETNRAKSFCILKRDTRHDS